MQGRNYCRRNRGFRLLVGKSVYVERSDFNHRIGEICSDDVSALVAILLPKPGPDARSNAVSPATCPRWSTIEPIKEPVNA